MADSAALTGKPGTAAVVGILGEGTQYNGGVEQDGGIGEDGGVVVFVGHATGSGRRQGGYGVRGNWEG